ncbi:MAG: Methionyl-tRNA formyltransferase [Micavibrio sp.]|nr:Methionyl-tRNA formyltransferase [Micavibrio sp.]
MTDQPLRVIFMGTPDFSVSALQAVLDSRHTVICVYTQPPRPKGRGQQLQKSPVHLLAEAAGIEVRHPKSLRKDADARQALIDLKADVAVVAAYGLILPKDVLDAPRYGCINIHASLLPRWRGASPIQRSILAGDEMSGITVMQMEEGLDTGPMIAKESVVIGHAMTTTELHDALSAIGGRMIVPVLDTLARDGRVEAEIQDDSLTCYAPMLTKEDGRVDWTKTAAEIDRQVRALNPWPGVWAVTPDGKRFKILQAVPVADIAEGSPGTLQDKRGLVICGDGTALKLLKIQPDNGKPMDIAAALNGGIFIKGMIFS